MVSAQGRAVDLRLPAAPLVRRALRAAEWAHEGQFRVSGDPAISHAIAVGELLARHGADDGIIAAGLLHDVLEDTELCVGEIRHSFGSRVADIVLLMSKRAEGSEPPVVEELHAGNSSIRSTSLFLHALVVKAADRLHNLATVGALSRERQRRLAVEAIEVLYPATAQVAPSIAAALHSLSRNVLAGTFDDGEKRDALYVFRPVSKRPF